MTKTANERQLAYKERQAALGRKPKMFFVTHEENRYLRKQLDKYREKK